MPVNTEPARTHARKHVYVHTRVLENPVVSAEILFCLVYNLLSSRNLPFFWSIRVILRRNSHFSEPKKKKIGPLVCVFVSLYVYLLNSASLRFISRTRKEDPSVLDVFSRESGSMFPRIIEVHFSRRGTLVMTVGREAKSARAALFLGRNRGIPLTSAERHCSPAVGRREEGSWNKKDAFMHSLK